MVDPASIGAFLVVLALFLFCCNTRIPEEARQPVAGVVLIIVAGFAIRLLQWMLGGVL